MHNLEQCSFGMTLGREDKRNVCAVRFVCMCLDSLSWKMLVGKTSPSRLVQISVLREQSTLSFSPDVLNPWTDGTRAEVRRQGAGLEPARQAEVFTWQREDPVRSRVERHGSRRGQTAELG